MQAVFYPPVSTYRMGKPLGIGRDGVDEISLLKTDLSCAYALPLHHANASQAFPAFRVWKRAEVIANPVAPSFQSPMPFIGFFGVVMLDVLDVLSSRKREIIFYGFV